MRLPGFAMEQPAKSVAVRGDGDQVSPRRLTVQYLVALGLLAAIVVGSHLIVRRYTEATERLAELINLSGRQRMLFKRSVLLAENLVAATDGLERARWRQSLLDTVGLLARSHARLAGDDGRLRASGPLPADVREIYLEPPLELDANLHSYVETVRSLVRAPVANLSEQNSDLQSIRETFRDGRLLRSLGLAVQAYQRESEQRMGQLKRLGELTLFADLFVLVLVGVVLFRPMVKRIRSEVEALRELNRTLEARVTRRTAALSEAEARYRDLFDHAPDMMAVIHMDTGEVTDCNETLAKALDRRKQDMVGRHFLELYAPEDRTVAEETLEEFARLGEVTCHERTLRRADGRLIHVELQATAVRDERGEIVASRSTWRDISELKRAQRELAKKEALYRTLVEAIPHVIWQADSEGGVIFLSRAWQELTGLEPAASVGQQWAECLHPEDRPGLLAKWEQAYQHGEAFQGECRFRAADGSHRDLEYRGTPVRSEDGRIISWVGINIDVTERKRAEQAVRDSQERLKLALEAGQVGTWLLSLKDNSVTADDRLQEIFGAAAGESMHAYDEFLRCIHPDDVPYVTTAIQQALEHNRDYDVVFRVLWPDRSLRYIAGRGSVLHDERGRPAELVGVSVDITGRVEEQRLLAKADELQRSNQDLEQFAYIASHDLRAPLRAIANLSEWLAEDLGEQLSADARRLMDLMRGRVKRLESLIDDLLKYSRAGRLSGETTIVDTGELLRETVALLAPPESFHVAVGAGMPVLETARAPLEHVFTNLIGNALKHHDRPDGRVDVSVRDAGAFWEFVVSDDGPGIPAEFHDRVFRVFHTLKPRDEVEASGIGLSIVKRAVERHGGSVVLESGQGGGTTFRFTWPKQMQKGGDSEARELETAELTPSRT